MSSLLPNYFAKLVITLSLTYCAINNAENWDKICEVAYFLFCWRREETNRCKIRAIISDGKSTCVELAWTELSWRVFVLNSLGTDEKYMRGLIFDVFAILSRLFFQTDSGSWSPSDTTEKKRTSDLNSRTMSPDRLTLFWDFNCFIRACSNWPYPTLTCRVCALGSFCRSPEFKRQKGLRP